MCQPDPYYIGKVVDGIINQPSEYFMENDFLFEKIKLIIRQIPVSSLVYLFDKYRITEKLPPAEVTRIFQKLSPYCYLSFAMFVNNLCAGKLMFMEKDIRRVLITSLEFALESHQIPLTGQNRVMQALLRLRNSTLPEEIQELKLTIPFDPGEVLSNIDCFLKNADALADLPEFSSIYFSKEQIRPIGSQLENHRLNPFGKKYIQQLVNNDTEIQKIIKRQLIKFINLYPFRFYTKQAFAVYITLGKTIPWENHPFIIRLIANSYWEQKALSLN